MCITQGFPSIPFFVDEDVSTSDGVIRCRKISTLEMLSLTWKELRALTIILGGLDIHF